MAQFDPREVDEVLDEAYPKPSEKLPPGSEAPASATVHVWDKDNFGVLFTIRDTNAKNLYVRMNGLIQTLKNDGWKPDWKTEGVSTPPVTQKAVVGQSTEASQKSNAPICGVHGTPMHLVTGVYKTDTKWSKAGEKYEFWSCSEKNADGSYCKYKPGK